MADVAAYPLQNCCGIRRLAAPSPQHAPHKNQLYCLFPARQPRLSPPPESDCVLGRNISSDNIHAYFCSHFHGQRSILVDRSRSIDTQTRKRRGRKQPSANTIAARRPHRSPDLAQCGRPSDGQNGRLALEGYLQPPPAETEETPASSAPSNPTYPSEAQVASSPMQPQPTSAMTSASLSETPQQEPTEETPRGRKQRRKKTSATSGASIISFNGSCWTTAKCFLERTDAFIVLIQETKLDGEAKAKADQWCLRHKWQPFIAPYGRSAAGKPTAGTGVDVRNHIGGAPIAGPGAICPHPESIMDGWEMPAHLNFGMRGGLIVASVYLECGAGIGVEIKNWQRLLKIGGTMQNFGRPFVLGGDWNISAAMLS